MNRNRKYSNGTITVVWQSAECIHAGICFTRLRKVFDPVKRPWVNMDGASTEEIIDIVEQCPTRALTFFWDDPSKTIAEKEQSPKIMDQAELPSLFPAASPEDGTLAAADHAAAAAKISYRQGGPLVIEGPFTLTGEDGKLVQTRMKMVSLCRCGLSDNQPFCDGAHFKAGFRK